MPKLSHPETISLADYTNPALLVAALTAREAPAVIGEMAQRFAREGVIENGAVFATAVMERELKLGTASPAGVAFPHARAESVRQLRFGFGRFPAPVRWGGEHFPPVRLVCLVAIPLTEAAAYLRLMATLSWLCRNGALVKELLDATDNRAMMAVLSRATPLAQGRA